MVTTFWHLTCSQDSRCCCEIGRLNTPLISHTFCVQVNPSNHGMLLRQGELIVVDKNKHKRVVFLFENTIVFAKSRKLVSSDPHSPDTFEFKTEYKVH